MARTPVPESEEQILRAALRVFADRGYGATSLRDLMREAGLSTTAFYARFESKESVLDALLRAFTARLVERARTATQGAANVDEGFEHGARALASLVVEEKPLVRLALGEGLASEGARTTMRAVYDAVDGLLAARLTRLMEKHAIDRVDADALARALTGAMQFVLVRWAVFGEIDDGALGDTLARTARALTPAARARATTGERP